MILSERAIPLDDALGIVDRAISESTISSRKVAVRDGFGTNSRRGSGFQIASSAL